MLAEVVVVVVAAFEVVVVVTAAALVTGTAAFVTTVVGTFEVEVDGPAGANRVDELGPEVLEWAEITEQTDRGLPAPGRH